MTEAFQTLPLNQPAEWIINALSQWWCHYVRIYELLEDHSLKQRLMSDQSVNSLWVLIIAGIESIGTPGDDPQWINWVRSHRTSVFIEIEPTLKIIQSAFSSIDRYSVIAKGELLSHIRAHMHEIKFVPSFVPHESIGIGYAKFRVNEDPTGLTVSARLRSLAIKEWSERLPINVETDEETSSQGTTGETKQLL